MHIRVTITLPAALKDAIDEKAKELNETFSNFLAVGAEQRLGEGILLRKDLQAIRAIVREELKK